jgi:hypothetical protein
VTTEVESTRPVVGVKSTEINMKTIGIIRGPGGRALDVRTSHYPSTGALAVELFDPSEGPWSRLSVNLDPVNMRSMAPNEFILHHDVQGDTLKAIRNSALFEDTGRTANYGFVRGRPIYRLMGGAQ